VRALFKWGWSAARIATGRSFNGDELEQFIEDEALPDDLYLPEV
jgi:hypothetical protein